MITPEAITEFRGGYFYLSNFFIEPDGTHVEGEFQAAKCADSANARGFIGLDPKAAKQRGHQVRLRPDWEQVKDQIMYALVLRKFGDHPSLRKLLYATGDAFLLEGNWWGDTYWGAVDGVGRNKLGHILMRVRTNLRAVQWP